ncbi:MAG: tetratricopeptide repeat protein [Verrucomicrobiota bacterium]
MTIPQPPPRSDNSAGRRTVLGVCFLLAMVVFFIFGRTYWYGFVNYDDNYYVYENPVVQKGLTWEGLRWALTYGNIGHWHPLTWLSHMLDCQLYGLNPGGHHLTNILLHGAAAILLFLVLRRMTGFLWRSAFVAAVFAIHPLRVESVAWVAERKDVLSAFFFMLTIGAYVRYVQRRSKVESRESRAQAVPALDPLARRSEAKMARPLTLDYCLVLLFFALGLLSKNMLVTMPFVLLLLDYWPLNRLSGFSPPVLLRRVAEKIPLFVLTVGSCVATALVPEKVSAGNSLSFALRMENAVVSYVTYLWQMIHPSGLACVYPNPVNHLPFWQVAGALGLLLAISGAVWAFRKTHPCFVVGWLWYLGMMIPVIGIVQISYYAHADRYTYLPQIGLYLLLTWAAADLCAGWRHRRVVLGGLSTVILVALILCARAQTAYWRNSESLWAHALTCTSGNYIAHNGLGYVLAAQGRTAEATVHYQKAIEINPHFAEAHLNWGILLAGRGRTNEAIKHYQKALEINPDDAEADNNLGAVFLNQGRLDEAAEHCHRALEANPSFAEAHNNLGILLAKQGRTAGAIGQFQKALGIKPDYAEAHYNLANTFTAQERWAEAIGQFQKALGIKPDYAKAHYNLANIFTAQGRWDEAIEHYQRALKQMPDSIHARYQFGLVLQKRGKFAAAIVQFQKVLELDPRHVTAQNNLAWLLATCPDNSLRDGKKAVELAQQAVQLSGGNAPEILDTLAAAYAEAGSFPEAVETAQRALDLSAVQNKKPLAEVIQNQLKLFETHSPFHEKP